MMYSTFEKGLMPEYSRIWLGSSSPSPARRHPVFSPAVISKPSEYKIRGSFEDALPHCHGKVCTGFNIFSPYGLASIYDVAASRAPCHWAPSTFVFVLNLFCSGLIMAVVGLTNALCEKCSKKWVLLLMWLPMVSKHYNIWNSASMASDWRGLISSTWMYVPLEP